MTCLRRVVVLAVTILVASLTQAAEVNVFAAASLTDAFKELAPAFERESGHRLRLNLGASSTLARQIREGAPADVFFSADEEKMDGLAKLNRVDGTTRVSLLSNSLVIVVHAEEGAEVSSPADLAQPRIRRIALAETATVPAGIYSRQFLERANLWASIAPKVVATENVRAALAAVESGSVDAGMVYKTDALISKQVRIAVEIPRAEGPKIVYPAAVCTEAKEPQAAKAFLLFLQSPQARTVFERQGFIPLPAN